MDIKQYSLDEIKTAFLKAFGYMVEGDEDYSLQQLVKALRGEPLDEDED